MIGRVDELLVGLVLAASAVHAVVSLGPRGLRRRLFAAAAVLLLRLPAVPGLRALALRLQASAGAAGGSCGGCDDCGTPPAKPDAEIRVPLSSVLRRR